MKIKQGCKVREIAGENVVVMQGQSGTDFTRIITLNDSALLLWQSLENKDFTNEDVASVLTDNYEVDATTAARDAAAWVERMTECGLIE
jgi:hypothetical protein